MPEPLNVSIIIHAPAQLDEQMAAALQAHFRELIAACEQAGWQVQPPPPAEYGTLTLTMTKDTTDD